MIEADRIAQAKVEAARLKAAEDRKRTAARIGRTAAAEMQAIRSLSEEVLTLLASRGYERPDPEPLTLKVERVSVLGDLFGYRKVVKGGWKIAEWRFHPEKGPHQVWLLADGRYCWNGRIVSSSRFSDWHKSQPVEQGRRCMIAGLEELKENALR